MKRNYTDIELGMDLKKAVDEIGIFSGSMDALYHYTTLGGLKGILDDQAIHLSRIDVLNDTMEVQYFHDMIINEIRHSMSGFRKNHDAYYLKELMGVIENNRNELYEFKAPYGRIPDDSYLFCNEVYVCSFSGAVDSLDMWKYYAKGDGVCIEVKIDKGFGYYEKIDSYQKDGDTLVSVKCDKYIGKVVYDHSKQKRIAEILLQYGIKTYNKFCDGDYNETLTLYWAYKFYKCLLFPVALFMKHPKFSTERETRIVITKKYIMADNYDWDKLAFQGKYCNQYKLVDGIVKPYIKFGIDKEDIRRVYLSPVARCNRKVLIEYVKSKGVKIGDDSVIKSEIPLRF